MDAHPALPFKGLPFKDKGRQARHYLQQLDTAIAEVHQAMEALLAEYQQRFRPPRVANLTIRAEKTGERRLMWRAVGYQGRGQSYFSMIDSDYGRALLEKQTARMRDALLHYEARRADLNFDMGLAWVQRARLHAYLEWHAAFSRARSR